MADNKTFIISVPSIQAGGRVSRTLAQMGWSYGTLLRRGQHMSRRDSDGVTRYVFVCWKQRTK